MICVDVYRIGEFAKLLGVSVQLLKYYDQQGILHPLWKDETGRYYADYQSVNVMEYRYLSRTGLSLRDAQKLLIEGTLPEWCAHLSHARSTIENEILERRLLLQFVDEMMDGLQRIRQKESWRIEPWEGGWFMSKEQSSVYSWGENGSPVFQAWQRVILTDSSDTSKSQPSWGALLPKSFSRNMMKLDMIQGGSCFVYAHSIQRGAETSSVRLDDPAVDFREPLKIMADNGLKPRGDLYQRRFCVTNEEEGPWTQVVTRIPLR